MTVAPTDPRVMWGPNQIADRNPSFESSTPHAWGYNNVGAPVLSVGTNQSTVGLPRVAGDSAPGSGSYCGELDVIYTATSASGFLAAISTSNNAEFGSAKYLRLDGWVRIVSADGGLAMRGRLESAVKNSASADVGTYPAGAWVPLTLGEWAKLSQILSLDSIRATFPAASRSDFRLRVEPSAPAPSGTKIRYHVDDFSMQTWDGVSVYENGHWGVKS